MVVKRVEILSNYFVIPAKRMREISSNLLHRDVFVTMTKQINYYYCIWLRSTISSIIKQHNCHIFTACLKAGDVGIDNKRDEQFVTAYVRAFYAHTIGLTLSSYINHHMSRIFHHLRIIKKELKRFVYTTGFKKILC